MKLFIAAAAALALLSTTASAQQLTFVNPGSEEGMLRQVLNDIGQTHEHEFVQANTPVAAEQYLGAGNVVTIWSSEWPGNSDITSPEINSDNIVALLATETILCSREFDSIESMSGNTIKIATWGSEPVAKYLTTFGSENNIEFVVVPYDGSGSTARGYIGKDADTVFTIASKQSTIEEDTATTCFAFSATGDLSFRFVDAIVGLGVEPATVASLRSTVESLGKADEWNEKFAGTTVITSDDLNAQFQEAVANFTK